MILLGGIRARVSRQKPKNTFYTREYISIWYTVILVFELYIYIASISNLLFYETRRPIILCIYSSPRRRVNNMLRRTR